MGAQVLRAQPQQPVNACSLQGIANKVGSSVKSGYRTISNGMSNGINACTRAVERNDRAVKIAFTIVKFIAAMAFATLAVALNPWLTLGVAVFSLAHNLNLFPPTKAAENFIRTLWNKAVGAPTADAAAAARRDMAVVAAVSLGTYVAPFITAPIVMGYLTGERLAAAIQAGICA